MHAKRLVLRLDAEHVTGLVVAATRCWWHNEKVKPKLAKLSSLVDPSTFKLIEELVDDVDALRPHLDHLKTDPRYWGKGIETE